MKFVGRKFEGEEIRRGMIKEMTCFLIQFPGLTIYEQDPSQLSIRHGDAGADWTWGEHDW